MGKPSPGSLGSVSGEKIGERRWEIVYLLQPVARGCKLSFAQANGFALPAGSPPARVTRHVATQHLRPRNLQTKRGHYEM